MNHFKNKITGFARLALMLLTSLALVACGGGGGGGGDTGTSTTPVVQQEPMQAGIVMAKPLMDVAMVGQPYENTVAVVPNDRRNEIVSLAITNPTAGGAQPSINNTGLVTWTANDADFASTKVLRVTAKLKEGADVTVDTPVDVRKERLVYEVTLGPDEASYSDPEGRYLVRVKRADVAQPITGTLKVVEIFDAAGDFTWEISIIGAGGKAIFDVLHSPVIQPKASLPSSLSTQAAAVDHPLTPLELNGEFSGLTLDGSKLKKGTNVYTSRPVAEYLFSENGDPKAVSSKPEVVFGYYTNCSTALACQAKAADKSPIILIHGFSGTDNLFTDSIKGGGEGTWGKLAQKLTDAGHPVFEMRWITYMRFEEAAGQLAKFGYAVANHTLKKPIIIAHSFGGVVSHLVIQGKGREYTYGAWNNVNGDDIYSRLITLNSPLSGINGVNRGLYNPNKTDPTGEVFKMTRGMDHTDGGLGQIDNCYAITCLQAGAVFSGDPFELTWLRINAALIDGKTVDLANGVFSNPVINLPLAKDMVWEGESIKRLKDGLPMMNVPVLKVVGFNTKIINASDNNQLLGDGLLSLIGQAADPSHFANDPFNVDSKFGYKFISAVDTYPTTKSISEKKFSELEVGECIIFSPTGNKYYICAGSAHTATKKNSSIDYAIAHYESPLSEMPSITHPLKSIVEASDFITPIAYIPTPLANAPSSSIFWRAYVMDGLGQKDYSGGGVAKVDVLRKADGALAISYSLPLNPFGGYETDIGRRLTWHLQRIPVLSEYQVRITMGGGINTGSYVKNIENLLPEHDLGDIDLSPPPALVNVTGVVIDGQTIGMPIVGAEVWLSQGIDQTAERLRMLADNNVARKVTTDALGRFSVTGLRPGNYSALVSKAGYSDQLQGSVTVSANGSLSFSLLRVLNPGDAAITLRWASATGGSLVSSDLDSHLIRLNSLGAVDYHIYYSNPTVLGLLDSLDRDDVDYEGPETITLALTSGKSYAYYVHNFSGYGTTLPGSYPRVTLNLGSSVQQFELPLAVNTAGRYWRVFDIVNGQVNRCLTNCLQDIAPTGLQTQASSAILVPQPFRTIFENLPAKQ